MLHLVNSDYSHDDDLSLSHMFEAGVDFKVTKQLRVGPSIYQSYHIDGDSDLYPLADLGILLNLHWIF